MTSNLIVSDNNILQMSKTIYKSTNSHENAHLRFGLRKMTFGQGLQNVLKNPLLTLLPLKTYMTISFSSFFQESP